MSLPTPVELDHRCTKLLTECTHQLQRGFCEGIGLARDFPETLEAYKKLGEVLDKEAAVETAMSIKHCINQKLGLVDTTATTISSDTEPRKHVCCFVDGSSNSYEALRWSVTHLVDPNNDALHLCHIIANKDYTFDAEKILQEAMDYAHGAGGIKTRQIHIKVLEATTNKASSSKTSGVGEAIKNYVDENKIDVVVLGTRGLGSIKSTILGAALGMGSVSSFCIQNLRCPVMVVKAAGDVECTSVGGGTISSSGLVVTDK